MIESMDTQSRKVTVRYRKKATDLPKEEQVDEKDTPKNELESILESRFKRNIKIFAIVIFILSILLIISILSYSKTDEFVLSWGLREFFELLKGNEEYVVQAKSVKNLLGLVGSLTSNFFVNKTFGYFSVVIPLLIQLLAVKLFFAQKISSNYYKILSIVLIGALLVCSLLGAFENIAHVGLPLQVYGQIGVFVSKIFGYILGEVGGFVFALLVFLGYIIVVFDYTVKDFDVRLKQFLENSFERIKSLILSKKDATKEETPEEVNSVGTLSDIEEQSEFNSEPESQELITTNVILENFKGFSDERITSSDGEETELINEIRVTRDEFEETNQTFEMNEEQERFQQKEEYETEVYGGDDLRTERTSESTPELVINVDLIDEEKENNASDFRKDNQSAILISTHILAEKINYTPPPISLLIDDESKFTISEEELITNGRLLQEKLETFKIHIQDITATPGPVVTRYEFVPAPGIKISKIQSLADDIALAMKARGIRIIAPVPGKGTVGVEIPNKKPIVVRFGNCLKNAKVNPNFRLPIILGKTISGEVYVEDLAKMPHLLIAGATGSGKSVGINTIIASLIFKMHPQNLKFVIIDPKRVELTHYEKLLYHFLAVSTEIEDAVVKDPKDAVLILKALVAEMQLRYDILYSVQQKNIADYNRKVVQGLFKNNKEFEHRQMPYIVVIIDELADLMMTTSREIEGLIIRLAQLARAVGIHLVVATQRPSVDIITGLIKANFPARIAYLVSSRVDSRTILDTIGAERLLGNGDMLFLPSGSPTPIRIQNAFLTNEEVESICDFIANQKGYSQPYYLPMVEDPKNVRDGLNKNGVDSLFEEAARLVVKYQQASVSMLQRRLKIGYNRAGRIMDELEAMGIVSPFDGSKGREVKIATEEQLDSFLRSKGF